MRGFCILKYGVSHLFGSMNNERERDRLLMLDGRGVTTLSNLNNSAKVGV